MDVQKLIDDVERLRALMENWSAAGPAGALERDLLLEKLRRLYEAVLLSEPASARDVSGPCSEIAEEASASTDSLSDADRSQRAESERDAEPVAEKSFRAAEDSVPLDDEAARTPAGVSPGARVEAVDAPDTGSAAGAADVFSTEESSAEQRLFDDEPVARHRVDKQVILSLYGDTPVASPYAASAPYRKQEEASALTPVTDPDETRPRGAAPESPSQKVLGEVLAGSGATAMNEMLGKQTLHADVASQLQSQGLSGQLRQHIGVNDRFMLIRTLFGGDAAAYSETMERLDGFADLDDALLYMQENFDWDPDSEGVQLLVDLLERKLS